MVLIDVLFEMVIEVGFLFVNVAVPSGTTAGNQLAAFVHSAPGPFQVASAARAAWGRKIASALSSTIAAPLKTVSGSALRKPIRYPRPLHCPEHLAGSGETSLTALSPHY